jgi:hypothetical protein
VRLEGKAIGRVSPGFIAGEDVIFQDKTGLMAVDFRSMLGLIGNLSRWKRVPSISASRARRPLVPAEHGGYLILRELNTTAGS